jgi:hypothetical protein
LNPGRRGGKPATNRLSYGAAKNNLTFYWEKYYDVYEATDNILLDF